MSQTDAPDEVILLPPPTLPPSFQKTIPWADDLPAPPKNKWEREYQAFLRMRPRLLETHRGQFVAIHEGEVVEAGDDAAAVALRAYARCGYLPIYVGQITERRRVERLPGPREVPQETEP